MQSALVGPVEEVTHNGTATTNKQARKGIKNHLEVNLQTSHLPLKWSRSRVGCCRYHRIQFPFYSIHPQYAHTHTHTLSDPTGQCRSVCLFSHTPWGTPAAWAASAFRDRWTGMKTKQHQQQTQKTSESQDVHMQLLESHTHSREHFHSRDLQLHPAMNVPCASQQITVCSTTFARRWLFNFLIKFHTVIVSSTNWQIRGGKVNELPKWKEVSVIKLGFWDTLSHWSVRLVVHYDPALIAVGSVVKQTCSRKLNIGQCPKMVPSTWSAVYGS